MANTFTGTDEAETISPGFVSSTVTILGDATAPGDAEDAISPGGGGDTVDAGGGNDTIIEVLGAIGNDFFDGGPGDDRLEARAGRDTLEGGLGDDTADGGGGDDLFIQYLSEYADIPSLDPIGGDTLLGRAGFDTVDYSEYEGLIEIDLDAGFARFPDDPGDEDSLSFIENVLVGSGGGTIRGSDAANDLSISAFVSDVTEAYAMSGLGGDDTILALSTGRIDVDGGLGNDTIQIFAGSSVRVFGGGGRDTIRHDQSDGVDGGPGLYNGGPGRDLINGGASDDDVRGGAGRDELYGRGGSDVVNGGGGNDLVFGDTSFVGGNGIDTLAGGAGDDVLVGGFQADDLYGGPGNDRFVFRERFDDTRAQESKPGKADRILGSRGPALDAPGASEGDLIDVSAIDARDSRPDNQRFRFGIETEGGVFVVNSGNKTIVYANLDADAAREFQLVIHDGRVRADDYSAADFIL